MKDKAALVLVELLMDEKCLTQIKQHRKLLLRVGIVLLFIKHVFGVVHSDTVGK